jgi:hypothetical protein
MQPMKILGDMVENAQNSLQYLHYTAIVAKKVSNILWTFPTGLQHPLVLLKGPLGVSRHVSRCVLALFGL